jgi:hypothetical protein
MGTLARRTLKASLVSRWTKDRRTESKLERETGFNAPTTNRPVAFVYRPRV